MVAVKSYSKVYNRLYYLYILNVIDWICTIVLLKTGMFIEANPIANLFIGNYVWGFVIKCAVPLLITVFITAQLYVLPQKYLKITNIVVIIGIVIYVFINMSHVMNFFILFFVV